jgi:hypothetical protein
MWRTPRPAGTVGSCPICSAAGEDLLDRGGISVVKAEPVRVGDPPPVLRVRAVRGLGAQRWIRPYRGGSSGHGGGRIWLGGFGGWGGGDGGGGGGGAG